MFGITDITLLHPLITVSHFSEAVKKASKKRTPISLKTNETELCLSVANVRIRTLSASPHLESQGIPSECCFDYVKIIMGCQVTFLYLKPFLSLFSLKVDSFFFLPKKSAYTTLSP